MQSPIDSSKCKDEDRFTSISDFKWLLNSSILFL